MKPAFFLFCILFGVSAAASTGTVTLDEGLGGPKATLRFPISCAISPSEETSSASASSTKRLLSAPQGEWLSQWDTTTVKQTLSDGNVLRRHFTARTPEGLVEITTTSTLLDFSPATLGDKNSFLLSGHYYMPTHVLTYAVNATKIHPPSYTRFDLPIQPEAVYREPITLIEDQEFFIFPEHGSLAKRPFAPLATLYPHANGYYMQDQGKKAAFSHNLSFFLSEKALQGKWQDASKPTALEYYIIKKDRTFLHRERALKIQGGVACQFEKQGRLLGLSATEKMLEVAKAHLYAILPTQTVIYEISHWDAVFPSPSACQEEATRRNAPDSAYRYSVWAICALNNHTILSPHRGLVFNHVEAEKDL